MSEQQRSRGKRTRRASVGYKGQLLAMFDALGEWFREDNFKGCMFIKASAEFQEHDHAINAQAYAHKQLLVDHFEALARQAG